MRGWVENRVEIQGQRRSDLHYSRLNHAPPAIAFDQATHQHFGRCELFWLIEGGALLEAQATWLDLDRLM